MQVAHCTQATTHVDVSVGKPAKQGCRSLHARIDKICVCGPGVSWAAWLMRIHRLCPSGSFIGAGSFGKVFRGRWVMIE